MNRDLSDLRESYNKGELDIMKMSDDPHTEVKLWLADAVQAELPEPNAFTLSTVDVNGHPDGRIVLLKEVDDSGYIFYTNYNSQKGTELAERPYAASTFLWKGLERQLRMKGSIEKVSREKTNQYFKSRPYESRIGAYTSDQSSVISSRAVLHDRQTELKSTYPEGTAFDAPEHWGGYRLIPTEIEFWQGRPSRLHDRIRYRLVDTKWIKERLAP